MNKSLVNKLLISLIGMIILSIGLNMVLIANIGTGPFDTLVIACQDIIGVESFANASFLFHMIFVVIMIVFNKFFDVEIKDALLSAVSIFIITRFIAWFDIILAPLNLASLNLFLVMIVGFLLFSLGIYLLAVSNIIIAPYDKFSVQFAKAMNFHFGTFRVVVDVATLVAAYIISTLTDAGVVFSIGTLVITIGTGSCIRMFEFIHQNYFKGVSQ